MVYSKKSASQPATKKAVRKKAPNPTLRKVAELPAKKDIKKIKTKKKVAAKPSTQWFELDFWFFSLVVFFAMSAFAAVTAGTTYLSVASVSNFDLVSQEKAPKNLQLEIKGESFSLEAVNTPADMYRGLSGRKKLCSTCGMLFIFPNSAVRHFVMRDMMFPLDIIFLSEGKIVQLHENLAPEGSYPANLYSSLVPADTALEINAGLAHQLGLKVGDRLNLPNLSAYR